MAPTTDPHQPASSGTSEAVSLLYKPAQVQPQCQVILCPPLDVRERKNTTFIFNYLKATFFKCKLGDIQLVV